MSTAACSSIRAPKDMVSREPAMVRLRQVELSLKPNENGYAGQSVLGP
jgi:hypothetical protein